MAQREFSVGEHNVVAHALFELQAKRRAEAHQYRQSLAPYLEKGDDHPVVRDLTARAEALEAESRAAFNLELLVRRYLLVLASPIHIPEQA